ncbi:condensation domain-containing protein [Streptomyces sp. NPDC058683]|uniref:condensation domain-containing protein n=1 Tax=Streptomyces sp. NPDC058683 TaxID=3346597 RepID=UPI00365B0851
MTTAADTGAGRGADAERLRTRLRWQKLIREPEPGGLRVALLASYTVDPLVPYLGTALADSSVRAEFLVAPFNQIERQCLDDESATARFAPHVVVVAPRLEELWAGRALPSDGTDAEAYETDLRYLADACVAAAARWQADLLFVLPEIPRLRPTGVGDDGNPDGVMATAARAREALRRSLAGRDRVALVDAELVLRSVGSAHAYRPALLASARIPYSEEYFDLLGRRIGRLVALRRATPARRLIVLDGPALDGAAQQSGTRSGDRGSAGPETDLHVYLAETARAGAVIALSNTGEETAAGFSETVPLAGRHGIGSPIVDQLRSLMADLAPDGARAVFLTTVPESADVVRQELPEVSALLLPPDREYWAVEVDRSGLVDRLPPTPREVTATGGAAGRALTLEGFLAGLRLNVECAPLSPDLAEAAADLTRRVAEFHLDGVPRAAEHFAGTAGTAVRWGVRASDRFGDHGLCGVVGAVPDGDTLRVDLWTLTCPVLGKGVEERVLEALAALARERGCGHIAFAYRPTARNDAVHGFLAGLRPEQTLPREQAATVLAPVAALTDGVRWRKPADTRPARASRPRRRPAGPATGRFTTAAQILEAVESRTRAAVPAHLGEAPDEGGLPRTDTERRLADVFATILGRPSVGVNCNFFSGGDSMLAVQLIAKANRAGLRLSLRQVFKYQTVAALAAVATVTEQGQRAPETQGPAPLLPLQSWFFRLGLEKPNHFNQSQRFELPADADADALRQAVTGLLAHHPSLRTRFVRTGAGWQQIDPGVPEDIPFDRVDLSGTAEEDWPAALAGHERALHLDMSPEDGRLARFAFFEFGPRRPPHLLVIFHHLAIDGMSWRFLLEDLQDAYQQALNGEPVMLTPVTTSALTWAGRLHEYAQSPEIRAELPRWLTGARSEVEPLPRDVPAAAATGVLTHSVLEVFTAQETRRLRERAVSEDHTSVDVLLLAAATRSLARWSGHERFLFDVVNHGREPSVDGVDLSRTVGWMVLNVPVLFETGGHQELTELIPAIGGQLRDWSSTHGAGDNLLRFLSEDEQVRKQLADLPSADVLFSYAGHVDPGAHEHPLLGPSIAGQVPDIDPAAVTPYALQLDAMIVGDRLQLEVCYRHTQFHTSTAERLLEGWTSGLRQLVGGTPTVPDRPMGPHDRKS